MRIGDWKLDTDVGKPSSSSFVSIVKRKSRIVRFIKVNKRKADIVSFVIIEQLKL